MPKLIALFVLLSLSILVGARYMWPEKSPDSIPVSIQTESNQIDFSQTTVAQSNIELPAGSDQIRHTDNGLFTDAMICKAITNAIVGASPSIMTTNVQSNKIIVSFIYEPNGKHLSYDCKRIDNRFYWESSTKFLSKSIIEVETNVVRPRTDELIVSIYDTLDTGRAIKTYTIDQFQ